MAAEAQAIVGLTLFCWIDARKEHQIDDERQRRSNRDEERTYLSEETVAKMNVDLHDSRW